MIIKSLGLAFHQSSQRASTSLARWGPKSSLKDRAGLPLQWTYIFGDSRITRKSFPILFYETTVLPYMNTRCTDFNVFHPFRVKNICILFNLDWIHPQHTPLLQFFNNVPYCLPTIHHHPPHLAMFHYFPILKCPIYVPLKWLVKKVMSLMKVVISGFLKGYWWSFNCKKVEPATKGTLRCIYFQFWQRRALVWTKIYQAELRPEHNS